MNKLKIFIITISIVIGPFILIRIDNKSNLSLNFQDYCNSVYGNESIYNPLKNEIYEIRSCDIITNNSIIHNYFTYTNDYLVWQDKLKERYTCPKFFELNKWACWENG